MYCIVGNFRMVHTFVIFTDGSTTAKVAPQIFKWMTSLVGVVACLHTWPRGGMKGSHAGSNHHLYTH